LYWKHQIINIILGFNWQSAKLPMFKLKSVSSYDYLKMLIKACLTDFTAGLI